MFKHSRFEPLYQPYFGFWLFAWSRCGRIKKSSRKDSWYQYYSVLLTNGTSIGSAAAGSICAPNRPKHLNASCVYFFWKNHYAKYRSPSVLVICIEPGSLLVVLKMSVRSLSLRRNRNEKATWFFPECVVAERSSATLLRAHWIVPLTWSPLHHANINQKLCD